MLTFVTSLRHPHNATDYSRVERLLANTLRSVTAQTNSAFRVVVVGNQAPSFALPSGVEFVPVDIPPPSLVKGAMTGREAVLGDKGIKLAIGLLAARKHSPTHVMPFDADDYVSRRIAAHVVEDHEANGWYVDQGFRFVPTAGVARSIDRFHERCGTSFIVRYDLYDVPELEANTPVEDVRAAFGDFTVRELLGSHHRALSYFAEHGAPLSPLPFPGAVYTVETGENHSGKTLTQFALPVSRRTRREFTLPAPPRAMLARAAVHAGRVAASRVAARRS